MSATAAGASSRGVHATVELVLGAVAHEVLVVLAEADLVLLATVRVVRVWRRAVCPPHSAYLQCVCEKISILFY